MTSSELYVAVFLGAVASDLLTLIAEMKEDAKLKKKWRRLRTYAGILLQGVLPMLFVGLVLRDVVDSTVSAAAVGAAFPQILQKFAMLTPRLDPGTVPGAPGAADRHAEQPVGLLEGMRRFFRRR